MEANACARAVKAIAAAIALLSLSACADLHLDQGPDQVIQRTEGEDNFAVKQKAGPIAARVLPYALLAEQSYDPRVYATHRFAPRATTCVADDPKDCDARADDRRAARWLSEWRYVWSCDGPEECRVRTPGRSEPVGGLGVQVWARKGARCPEAVIAFRGTVGGNKGDWESNFHWILRDFPIYDQYDQVRDHIGDFIGHIERDPCYRPGLTQIIAVGHSLGGGLAQLAAYSDRRIRRVYAFDPSMVTGFYSVDPPHRDRNVQGQRIERVYELGESPRLRPPHHAAFHPFVALQSTCRQRPLPCLPRRPDRSAQPDRSRQRSARSRSRPRARDRADGPRAMRAIRRSRHSSRRNESLKALCSARFEIRAQPA